MAIVLSPPVAARRAGLRYVDDEGPGIERVKRGAGFEYRRHDGSVVRDPATLKRIASLVIPPAWTQVWICPSANGHIQATGRDARGRKQYRYHKDFRRTRDETKYEKVLAFGEALPKLRARVAADLRRPRLDRERVLAVVVRLLETTLIRVGNEEYARTNKSFGLTTLRDNHVKVNGGKVKFHFRGKSRIEHDVEVSDPHLAKLVKKCQDIPGQLLFQYYDADGRRRGVSSQDVNAYLREAMGDDFTAKDFRTWAGTVLAAEALRAVEACTSNAQAKKALVSAVRDVAARLGNTPTVCRNCYIHPVVLQTHLDGELVKQLAEKAGRALKARSHGLKPEEHAVLALLQRKLSSHRAPAKLAA